MPELPEVETLTRFLRPVLIELTPIHVEIKEKRLFRGYQYLSLALGHPIKEVLRRGKLMLWQAPPYTWAIHLKMTGQLWWHKIGRPLPPYTYIIINFLETDYQLCYADVRKFGYIKILPTEELYRWDYLTKLGPDALSVEASYLLQCFSQKSQPIKKLLLDQQIMAGLGNIYSDEALWMARIHPLRPAYTLSPKEVIKLTWAIKKALNRGIKFQGTSMRNYVLPNGTKGKYQYYRLVYGKKGESCYRCKTEISRIKIAGRNSYFCPKCQK